jgi:hypothetical protein
MTNTLTRLSIGVLLIAATSVARLSASEPTDPTKNYMGINVDFLNDYDGENAFVDIMKHARYWFDYSVSQSATVDSDNWPTEDCSNVMFGVDNALGVYKLVFEGKAQSVSVMWTSGSVSNLTYNAATNTSTANVTLSGAADGSGGLKFQGTQRTAASATNTGIRNVRLYRPGYPTDGSVVFTNEWLAIVGKFQAIRFMNWLMTNENPIVSWNQRMNPLMAQPSGSAVTINGNTGSNGNAMEHFIQACNAANADLWMNIPVLVNDDYIIKTAQLILYGSDGRNPYTSSQPNPVYPPLNSNLKVYVELGNEIWNVGGGFQCFHFIQHVTDSIIGVAGGRHPIEYDGFRDHTTSIARWTAWRTAEISSLFRGVFGDAAMMTRVRPVLMGQLGSSWFNPTELPFLEGLYSTYRPSSDHYPNTNPRPVSYYVYAAGGSGYYGVKNWSTSPEVFFSGGNYPDSGYGPAVAYDAILAGNYGLKRIGYEGGMSLDGGSYNEAQMLTLNADPRMKDVTVAYHNVWSSNAGDLLVYFEDIHNGKSYWEFTNSVNNPNSPKLQAIDKLRDTLTRAPVLLGGVAPCTTYVSSQTDWHSYVCQANGFFYSTVNTETVLDGIDTGEWVALPVTARQAGWYKLSARCGSPNGTSTVDLYLNGTRVSTRTAGSSLANTPYSTVALTSGLNVVRYQPSKGSSYLRSIMLTPSDTAVGVVIRQAAGLRTPVLTVKSASGAVVAHVPEPSNGENVFAVFDVAGKCIARGVIGAHEKNLILPRLAADAYLLRIRGSGARMRPCAENTARIVAR